MCRSARSTGSRCFTVETTQHTTDPVDYAQSPPIGGMHDSRLAETAASTTPRSATRTPSTPWSTGWSGSPTSPTCRRSEVDALRQLTLVNDRLLISPYPGLDAPIVLSTWDRQLRLDTVDDPRLFEFIDAYTNQAPEPNASCQGQVATPAWHASPHRPR